VVVFQHINRDDMKLSDAEKQYIEKTCNIYKDERLAFELTRIRYEMGVRESVTIDQVRKARYKMGIAKKAGRGKCQVVQKEKENE